MLYWRYWNQRFKFPEKTKGKFSVGMLQLDILTVKGLNQPLRSLGGGCLRSYAAYFHIITGRVLPAYWFDASHARRSCNTKGKIINS